jgi:UDPglucose 6-dehydrogenase
MKPKVGVVGMGAVGTAIAAMFKDCAAYDEPKALGSRPEINACDVAFVCVPTPSTGDGGCDTSIVDEVVSWIETPTIIIRSTVSVGTCRRLAEKHKKEIVFQPEYGPAETPDHPFNDLRNIRWIILGGPSNATARALRVWRSVYSSDVVVRRTTWEAAELCKYMENAYLAMKVTFCNEFFELASRLDVDYDELRELWLMDPRMGRSHTWVFPESRGFGGKCLPKDLSAVIKIAEEAGYDPGLLKQIQRSNGAFRQQVAVSGPASRRR